MDELEQKLNSRRLAAPSASFDRRIDALFSAAPPIRKQSSRTAIVAWWLTALTAAGGMAALLLVAPHRPATTPHAVVYQIEAQGRMREMLLTPAASPDEPPRFVMHVSSP